MQEMLLTDDPKIVNGSKLSKEELKQLLEEIKKPSPNSGKAGLFLWIKKKNRPFQSGFQNPCKDKPTIKEVNSL